MSSNDLRFKIKTLFQGQLYTFDPNKQFLKYNKYGHTTSLFKLSWIIYFHLVNFWTCVSFQYLVHLQ